MRYLIYLLFLSPIFASAQYFGPIYNPASVAVTGGTIKLNDGSAASPSYSFGNAQSQGFFNDTIVSGIGWSIGGVQKGAVNANGFYINGNAQIGPFNVISWGASTYNGAFDVAMFRDAPGYLALRNGTSAQSYSVYNTYTDALNYERGIFDWQSVANVLTIGTSQAGTGIARSMRLKTGGVIDFFSGATPLAELNLNAFQPYSNASISLGVSNTGFSRLYLDYTNTATVGAVTINKPAGRVNVAAAGTSIVVTDSISTAAAHIFCNIANIDSTAKTCQVTPANGSFTITLNSAATAQIAIDFFIVSAD